jgi:hypothetical protein
VGFISGLLAPRAGRRGRKPGRANKRATAANLIKKTRGSTSPAGNSVYSIERSVTTTSLLRGKKKRKTTKTTTEWRHGKCQVKHRSREAAARCRNP